SAGKRLVLALDASHGRAGGGFLDPLPTSESGLVGRHSPARSRPSMAWLFGATRASASTRTPEPSERCTWSPDPPGAPGPPKKRRKIGSSNRGLRTATVLAA